jgi:hypothetical protein
MTRRVLWASVLLGSLLSLGVSYAVATKSIVVGSHEGHWVYDYAQPFDPRSLAVFLLASALSGALLAVRVERLREWSLVLAWFLIALGLQALVRSVTPYTFERIFASDGANSFYSVARQYSATDVLGDFGRLRPSWPLHAKSNLPGKLLLVHALMYISRRPDVLAWLVVAVSNLGGVLMYIFVRDLFADRRVALFSLVLYFFVPAKLFFFPLLNTVTPVVVLACACLLLRWLMTGRAVYAALLGVALYGLTFFEPLPLAMGLLFAALTARALWRSELAWRTFLLQTVVVVIAFAATYAFMSVWFGFDLIDALRQIGADAVAFNAAVGRPYSIWVQQNLIDFIFAIGVCQAVIFSVALGDGLSGGDGPRSRLTQPITVLCLALAAILLAIDFIGVNRGEVIRLWVFLACFFQIPAAYVCARIHNRAAIALLLATTLLQDVLGTSMIGFIVP